MAFLEYRRQYYCHTTTEDNQSNHYPERAELTANTKSCNVVDRFFSQSRRESSQPCWVPTNSFQKQALRMVSKTKIFLNKPSSVCAETSTTCSFALPSSKTVLICPMQTPSSSIKHSSSTRTTLPATRKSRSKQHKSYCTFMVQNRPKKTALHDFIPYNDMNLASGFAVASADLELRGSGDLLGKEQSDTFKWLDLTLYWASRTMRTRAPRKRRLTSFDWGRYPFRIDSRSYIPETEDRLRECQKLSWNTNHGELRELAERWILPELPTGYTPHLEHGMSMWWCTGILNRLKKSFLLMLHPQCTWSTSRAPYTEFPTTHHPKKVDTQVAYATFQKEEAQTPFGFLFWLFQELRMCMIKPIH